MAYKASEMTNSSPRTCLTIILAAGDGTRMRSSIPKVLHPVAGLPMVGHVIKTALAAGCDELALVIGGQAERVKEAVGEHGDHLSFFEQSERLGTGHAVLSAKEALEKGFDDVMVLFGDTPLTTAQTLKDMRKTLAQGYDVAVLGFEAIDPTGYGRLVHENGEFVAIREHKDASAEELKITLCNGGIMMFGGKDALGLLNAIENNNAKGEYYLTDLVEIARERGGKVTTCVADEEEIMGVNTRVELSTAEEIWQQRKRRELMLAGVSMHAPNTVYFQHDSEVEPEVQLEQNIVFGPGVVVRSGATIRAFCHLEGAEVRSGATVGPYARLRPGAHVGENSKVGNFCEIKNASLAEGAKVNHLSYVGDSTVGAGANLGAGTITCNYDGANKHHTSIGNGVFIGSNSALVAPVKIGENAYVASGSVITEDVPADALGIGRGRQANKEGYGRQIRERNLAEKQSKKQG